MIIISDDVDVNFTMLVCFKVLCDTQEIPTLLSIDFFFLKKYVSEGGKKPTTLSCECRLVWELARAPRSFPPSPQYSLPIFHPCSGFRVSGWKTFLATYCISEIFSHRWNLLEKLQTPISEKFSVAVHCPLMSAFFLKIYVILTTNVGWNILLKYCTSYVGIERWSCILPFVLKLFSPFS